MPVVWFAIMHGKSVLIRCEPFHKLTVNGKSLCGITVFSEYGREANAAGWVELPDSRCKRCQKRFSKKNLTSSRECVRMQA